MIVLAKGKRVLHTLKVSGKLGSGFVYILNRGISFEVSGKGTVLELENAEIIDVRIIKKDKFVITWLEGSKKHESKFKSEKAKEVVCITNENMKRPN